MFLDRLFNKRTKERKDTLLEIIDNQLSDDDPPGIGEVYRDFINRGYSDSEVRQMFAAVFEGEIHKLNNGRNRIFDRDFYLESLKAIK